MDPLNTFDLPQQQAARLKNGAVMIFPTETIYGIGCSVSCEDSIRRVFQIKGRALTQPPPILIHDEEQLSLLVAHISPAARALMEKYWPGSLTLVLPAHPDLSPSLSGFAPDGKTRTVGVRRTAHPIARALCQQIGAPIIATSANFNGATGREAAPQTLEDIPASFKNQVDIVVDGGILAGTPSTIVDCVFNPPRVLRTGAVSFSDSELQQMA